MLWRANINIRKSPKSLAYGKCSKNVRCYCFIPDYIFNVSSFLFPLVHDLVLDHCGSFLPVSDFQLSHILFEYTSKGQRVAALASRVKEWSWQTELRCTIKKRSWTTSNCYSQLIRLFLHLSLSRQSQELTKRVPI